MKSIFAVICLSLSAAAWAQTDYNVGSQAAPWLLLPQSSRSAAMGGATVALSGDVDLMAVNPAGLASLSGQEVSLMHDAYVQETSLEHIAYGLGLGSKASDGVAVSANYMNYGSIAGYSNTGGTLQATGDLSPYGLGVDLGYGHRFGQFMVGAAAEMVTENLGQGANSTAGADLGVLWRQTPSSGLSVGAAVQNLGGQLDGANLPTDYQAGLAYEFLMLQGRQSLILEADGSVPSADAASETLAVGAEYSGESAWDLRAGYRYVGNNGISGLSAGAGLNYRALRIDYAFVMEGVLGDANQFSVGYKF